MAPWLGRTALVTGATGGLGEQLAGQLAASGADLVLSARSGDRLAQLATRLRGTTGVRVDVVAADLAQHDGVADLLAGVQGLGVDIDILVNNAGFGHFGEFVDHDQEHIAAMMAVNMTSVAELTRAVLPGMVARGRGWVLNVASTAAFQAGPLMSLYYATKAFVLSLSEGLHEELRPHGVTVTALCPGPTATGFEEAANLGESKLFEGPMRMAMLSPHDVVQIGLRGMEQGRAVVVPGRVNEAQVALSRVVPRAVLRRATMMAQGRRSD